MTHLQKIQAPFTEKHCVMWPQQRPLFPSRSVYERNRKKVFYSYVISLIFCVGETLNSSRDERRHQSSSKCPGHPLSLKPSLNKSLLLCHFSDRFNFPRQKEVTDLWIMHETSEQLYFCITAVAAAEGMCCYWVSVWSLSCCHCRCICSLGRHILTNVNVLWTRNKQSLRLDTSTATLVISKGPGRPLFPGNQQCNTSNRLYRKLATFLDNLPHECDRLCDTKNNTLPATSPAC